jgi:hypothetical protein
MNKHSVISDPGALCIVHRADAALQEIQSDLRDIQRNSERFHVLEKKRHQRLLQANVAALLSHQRHASAGTDATQRQKRRGCRGRSPDAGTDISPRRPVIADILDDFDRRSKLPLPSDFDFQKVDQKINPLVEQRSLQIQSKMAISDSMPVHRVIGIIRRSVNSTDTGTRSALRAVVAEQLEVLPDSDAMSILFADDVDLSAISGRERFLCPGSPVSPAEIRRGLKYEDGSEESVLSSFRRDEWEQQDEEAEEADADVDVEEQLIKRFLRFKGVPNQSSCHSCT